MNSYSYTEIKLDYYLNKALMRIGCNPGLNGFEYVTLAIKYLLIHRTQEVSIVWELYPAIAQMKNSSPWRVERNIRHLIQTTWARGRAAEINKLFGAPIYQPHEIPTNGDFLHLLALVLSQKFYYFNGEFVEL